MSTEPSGSLTPDLDGQICCTAMCFDVADIVGLAKIRINPDVGLPIDQETQHLELPLCMEHAHLLRMGGTLLDIET